ncbi:MAG: hypothetical protein ISS00_04405 [Candidatus Marinimicrobia bacterium]|nr:hypothetical protein [Candidatus Neomarinimicrobiota bacterium]
MEKTAYIILGIVAIGWALAVLFGLVVAFPFGLIGLAVIIAIGLLFIRVLLDRIGSAEDDYYDKNVDL